MTDQHPTSPSAPPTRQGVVPSEADAPTSKLAIASLILGVLGFCTGITALIGLILGIIGLRQIRQSDRRLRGQGVAIAGMAVSGGALLTTVFVSTIWLAMLLPALGTARQAAQEARATTQARQMAAAMTNYHADNQSAFPPADSWRDALTSADEDTPNGPIVLPGGFSYNDALARWHAYDVPDAARTVVFFETPSGSPISGGRELMADAPRHRDGYIIVFVDAHVETVPPELLDDLVWNVDDSDE